MTSSAAGMAAFLTVFVGLQLWAVVVELTLLGCAAATRDARGGDGFSIVEDQHRGVRARLAGGAALPGADRRRGAGPGDHPALFRNLSDAFRGSDRQQLRQSGDGRRAWKPGLSATGLFRA